jgi:hypothetical protein
MTDKTIEACKTIHSELLPRARLLRESCAALAEQERMDGDGISLYDGFVLALDDIIAAALKAMEQMDG